mmetsp:Transcript_5854/g.21190  ORF Transcript_5854/g.21190 Transcript_5854/m.21190 type:complete len:200 (-) Transcript_5854:690-1289(-)
MVGDIDVGSRKRRRSTRVVSVYISRLGFHHRLILGYFERNYGERRCWRHACALLRLRNFVLGDDISALGGDLWLSRNLCSRRLFFGNIHRLFFVWPSLFISTSNLFERLNRGVRLPRKRVFVLGWLPRNHAHVTGVWLWRRLLQRRRRLRPASQLHHAHTTVNLGRTPIHNRRSIVLGLIRRNLFLELRFERQQPLQIE